MPRLDLSYKKMDKIPAEVFEYTKLKTLILGNNDIKEIPKEIGNLRQLESLSIRNLYGDANTLVFPPSISDCTKLTHLKMQNNRLTALPKGIEHFKYLKKLDLSFNKISHIGEEILECENLEELVIQSNKLEILPAILSQLPQLKIINVNCNSISIIEKGLGTAPKLKEIWLEENQLSILPAALLSNSSMHTIVATKNKIIALAEIGSEQKSTIENLKLNDNQIQKLPQNIGNYKQLKLLGLSNNPIQKLPTTFGKLKKLRSLAIGGTNITEMPLELLQLNNIKHIKGHEKFMPDPHYRIFYKLIRCFKKQDTSFSIRYSLFQIFVNNQDYIQQLPHNFLLEYLHFPHKIVQDNIVQTLCKHFDAQNLSSASKITFLGNTIQKKKTIQERLEAQQIKYSNTFDKDTSHVLIGKFVKTKMPALNYSNLIFLNEQQLLFFLEEKEEAYIKMSENEERETLVKKVSILLNNQTNENILLAIEMLRGGGVPPEMLPLLMVIFKTSKGKVRTNLRKLLQLNGSYLLSYALNSNWRLDDPHPEPIGKKIQLLAKQTNLDQTLLTKHLIERVKSNIHALLLEDTYIEDSGKLQILSMYEVNKELSLDNMRFDNFPVIIGQQNRWEILKINDCYWGGTDQDSLGNMTNLRQLIIQKTMLGSLPKNIHQLQQLEELQLIHNSLWKMPPSFTELNALKKIVWRGRKAINSFQDNIFQIKGLESLELSEIDNEFQIKGLSNLTQLRQLILRDIQLDNGDLEELTPLTKLQTLDISHNNITEIPESFQQLQNLRKLTLSATNPEQKRLLYQLGQEIIPYCEIIFVP